MKKYLPRIIDKELKLALESMGAVLIEGPKWCGKTTTGLHHANSFIKMQDQSNMVNNKLIAETSPSLLLEGEMPVVMHRKNNCEWVVVQPLEDWIELYKEGMK